MYCTCYILVKSAEPKSRPKYNYMEKTHHLMRNMAVIHPQKKTFIPPGQTLLKVTYHPIYSMNNCVTNKAKLPLDGAQLFPYMG